MIKKITLHILLLLNVCIAFSQNSGDAQTYNSFTSRNFMKFNRFLTVPTFSALRENKTAITGIVRNSNVEFEDNPRLYLVSYSGKMRKGTGAGVAIYQQEVGVFKDFGAIANYAHRLQLNDKLDLTFGFNFMYSRRSADAVKVNSQVPDPAINNFQDVPIVNFQPAVTLSFGKLDVGLFFENLFDYNLKKNEMTTSFSDKTFSAHAMYTHSFENTRGLLKNANIRALGIARKSGSNGFGYGANIIADLPKAGWLKVGYDKTYGISAGLGVNISPKLAIGFAYEKSEFASTNEVGLTYILGGRSYRKEARRSGNIEITLPSNDPVRPDIEYDNPEHDDLSDEIMQAQDSIDALNKKVNDILKLLDGKPRVIKKNTTEELKEAESAIETNPSTSSINEEKDTSLKRSNSKPWREKTVTAGGSGGTMYYVALDRFKNRENLEAPLKKYKRLKIDAKYVRDPKTKAYFVYMDKFAKREDADEVVKEFNDSRSLRENEDAGDLAIKIKKVTKQPVYVVKITFSASGADSYQEPKTQPPARVKSMNKTGDIQEGYYLIVNVFSKKAYADKFIDELRSDGIDANYFINPSTGYRHVYILKANDRSEAIRMYENNLNNSYYDTKSIVHVR